MLISDIQQETGVVHYQSIPNLSVNCSVLEKATILFNSGATVFFTLTCILRFYIIVIRKPQGNPEYLPGRSQTFVLTIIGRILDLIFVYRFSAQLVTSE